MAHGQGLREQELIAVIRELAGELRPRRGSPPEVSLSSRLDRDLGIDSLARTELILRIERAFRVQLPISVVGEAETVDDMLGALQRARSRGAPAEIAEVVAPILPTVPAASEARTLIEVLERHVERHPDRLHLTILQDDVTPIGAFTYGDLAKRARSVAAGLLARDIVPGDRVALMLPTSPEFFISFFGILYAGAIPVPIYPPVRLSQLEDHLRRQAGILRNAGAAMLVTVPEGLRVARLLRGQVEGLGAIESVAGLELHGGDAPPPPRDETATALIQYTSGSTGDPKGVVLSHANLLANIRAMGRAMEATSNDVFVSWLPLYHDMGLIGAWLGCLHYAAPLYVMSPLSFLARPENWLRAVHRFRATLSASPNFGFELCLNKIDAADLAGLDLSSLRMVANGAEPVSVHTLRRFVDRFGRYRFREGAMAPVYGLAESAVGLAFPPPGRGPVVDQVDRDALSRNGVARPAGADDPKPVEIVGCGQALSGHEIRIVDQTGRELPDRHEGRLEFRGPSATAGYFRNEPKTRELFHDSWLDSGDRGYLAAGEVFITGRIKDIIIRAGRHIYPHEVEEAVGEIPGIRKGGVAVFGVTDPKLGTEQLVVVAETRETDRSARALQRARAQEVATDLFGAAPDDIVLVPPRSVPKTSSGKIRRSAAKDLYENGRIGMPQGTLGAQMLRLWFAGVGTMFRRFIRAARENAYATWWWLILALGCCLGFVSVLLLPRRQWRWHAVRAVARASLAAMAVPVAVSGLERIPRSGSILAFNHSSYVDVLVLAATLPGEPAFVAKKELARQIFSGLALRRLGALFVERYDLAGSIADAEVITNAARRGRMIVFFPEGTFTRRPGLAGFYLGAFKVAADSGLPVVPGSLRGTRSVLRGDQWFPRRAAISVEITEPVKTSGTDFRSILFLRDLVRGAILEHCGEPDIGELAKPGESPAA